MPRDVGQRAGPRAVARSRSDRMHVASGKRQGSQGVIGLSSETTHSERRAIHKGDLTNAHEQARRVTPLEAT